ncbi:MAG: tRNA (guanosine(46)-N7)-methyltransferase TrmB [Bacteroidia bacterium]
MQPILKRRRMSRRKQRKKNGYYELPNAYHPERLPDTWQEVFDAPRPLTLELGCGKAAFSQGMAGMFPDRNFLGIDIKPDRLWAAGCSAIAAGQRNLAFFCIHLAELTHYIPENEASELWITFPDPFPKQRQAKHRMINPPFMRQYRQVLHPDGHLFFKTDNLDLFHYSLEVFVRMGNIRFHHISFDLHADKTAPPFALIRTAYEQMFMDEGKPICYLELSFTDKV